MKSFLSTMAMAILMGSIPAYSHHSFAAAYFEEKSITVQGEVVEFVYQNPHAWVHIMVKDETGESQQYSAEWANPNRLRQQQITQETIKPGDFVIITGSPGRTASDRKIHLKRIVRPSDGWSSGGRNPGR